jgi:methyltransferase (TIGR00027 family)
LTFRTFNRDFDRPNHNQDDLAEKLRDALMPERGRLHREKSPKLFKRTSLLDLPYLGIPGIVNFVDCRTQWFDQGVRTAIDDGFTQVVIIAAGYDTRAYRFAKPGMRFYEVDLPHASKLKQKLVADLLPKSEVRSG